MDTPRQRLIALVARYGKDVCADPRRCESFLRDYCGEEYKREVFLLAAVVKEGGAAELTAGASGIPIEALLARLTKRLRDNLGIEDHLGRWAVESWAVALHLVPETGTTLVTAPVASTSRAKAHLTVATPVRTAPAGRRPSQALVAPDIAKGLVCISAVVVLAWVVLVVVAGPSASPVPPPVRAQPSQGTAPAQPPRDGVGPLAPAVGGASGPGPTHATRVTEVETTGSGLERPIEQAPPLARPVAPIRFPAPDLPTSAAPVIEAFEAVPTSVEQCALTMLRWTVRGASAVSIAPGVGAVETVSGYTVVHPVQSTRYQLTAEGPGGTVSSEVTVSVSNATRSTCEQ
jgi:hypothetical protein